MTQRELAARVAASRRTVQDWELGVNYPTADRLQALILVFLEAGGLTVEHEREEAEELWAAVVRDAPQMHPPFDDVWMTRLLADRATSLPAPELIGHMPPAASADEMGVVEQRQDWGEAPGVLGFVGRADELATLHDWVLQEQCRLVAVLGMGGIGKTTLAARLAQDLAPLLQRVYWRSLRDALPTRDWLAGAIGFLSDQQVVPPEAEAARLAVLLQLLRDRPSLLVLDNFDTLIEPDQQGARYRDGYMGYGRVLQAIGEGRHHSCLVVTSREVPPELDMLGGDAIRTLQLSGLGVAEAQALLANKQLSGTPDEWADLIAQYAGNGLALKVVGESIRQVFGGDLRAFLGESGPGTVFGGIRRLLAEQIERSSALEQNVLRVLAIGREPATVAELLAVLDPHVGRGALLDAVEALRRRSLVERAETAGRAAVHPLVGFMLQSMVLEYITDRLVEEVADEIARGQPRLLVGQPLIKAQAKDYVRQTQEHLIGEPILQRLQREGGTDGEEQRLLALLDGWRNRPETEQGYGPGNVVNLLRILRGDLRGLDLSRLSIRQAYLQEVEAQDTSLSAVHLAEAVLAGAFNHPVSVSLSADGRFMATGTSGGEVCLWRVADRTSLLAVQGHTGLTLVALSGDGRLLASGGEEGTIKLWEAPSGRLLATLKGHTGAVRGVALSGEGRLLASGSSDGTVKLWSLADIRPGERTMLGMQTLPSGRLLATLEGHTGPTRGVALSRDGRLLASGSTDGSIRLWSLADIRPGERTMLGMHTLLSGRLLSTMQGHTSAVWSVALSADGGLVASGSRDGTAKLWEASSGRLLATMQGHTGTVWGVALSGDGRLLASGSFDATARLWEAPSGRLLATLQGHAGAVQGVALSGDGRLLASGGFDATARLWEVPSGRLLATLQGHAGAVPGVALSGDGRLLASGNWDTTARVWEAPGGRLLASGSFDGTARLWETSSGKLLVTLEGHAGAVRGIALSGDGRLLASGSTDGRIRLWSLADIRPGERTMLGTRASGVPPSAGLVQTLPSGRLLATLEGNAGAVWGVALSGDGRLLASGSTDGTARLWDPRSAGQDARGGRPLASLGGHSGAVYGVALSWDGRLLASGTTDGTVRLWQAESKRLLLTLEGHTGPVQGVSLSSDARLLASGSWDGTARLWEAGTGRLLATLRGHTGAVWGVALSADGGLLASSSYDGTVRLWETSTGECVRTLMAERRYERMDITGLTGITDAQRQSMFALGAMDRLGGA